MLRARLLFSFFTAAMVAACSGGSAQDSGEAAESDLFSGTPKPEIGQLFMIEHYGVVAAGYPDVHAAIKQKNLGAVILWNPQNASGEVARQMVEAYAKSAHDSGRDELFVSADQEEQGTQRFKSLEGFTDLASGATLGRSVAANGDAKICELHGRIIARELAAVGMNMSLGTVSDIFTADSGTRGMFRTRGIDDKPAIVAQCVEAMARGYAEEKHVVYVTKHFPGLGNATGNTDVDPSVHTRSTTHDAMERELLPYRTTVASVNAGAAPMLFGTMISHASYPVIDASNSPATLSPVILVDLLRGAGTQGATPFDGIHLRGITVSDAFWTWGATKNLDGMGKRRLMLQSFLAGMDMLMIAHADFVAAWDYFQAAYANQLPPSEQAALVAATKLGSWDAVHARMVARVDESAARIHAAKSAVGSSLQFASSGPANANSGDLVSEYKSLAR